MLNTFDPFATIRAAVNPIHLTIALSFISPKFPSVNIATGPGVLSEPLLQIIHEGALVHVARVDLVTSPFAPTMLQIILKVTCVNSTVAILVLTLPVKLSILVLTLVHISICKLIDACTML